MPVSPPERAFRLTFKALPSEPFPARLTVSDAQAVVEALTRTDFTPERAPSEWERLLRSSYGDLYGAPDWELPPSIENSRWFRALKLSPHYMGEGAREAATELLSSPRIAYSVALSMVLYMSAWAAPEPIFSKAFAAAITLGLLMSYSAAELHAVGLTCLRLYQEAEASRTQEELDAAAEHFGKALGGVGLRVLVTVAGAKLARKIPEVPQGGVWTRISPPRWTLAGGGSQGGLSFGARASVQVSVANGTVVLMGASASTAASAVALVAAMARTTGDCRDVSNKGNAQGHHLATDKNDVSPAQGGPWTPQFKRLFDRAGMSLNDPANIVYLVGHVGPHPEEYHSSVFKQIRDAMGECETHADCRDSLIRALDMLASEICKRGTRLNRLSVRNP